MKKCITSERANLFEPNVYISTAVTLRGVCADKLIQAVKAAYQANEAAMSRIVLEGGGAAYYEPIEHSSCSVTVDSRELIDIIRDSEKRPFDLKNGELIRAYIIPSKEDSGMLTLLIHSHHLAGDGRSIDGFIRDILSCLSGKQPAYRPLLLADKSFLDSRATPDPRVGTVARLTERGWRKRREVFGWEQYYALHEHYWRHHSTDIRSESYDISELERLRTGGATINSVIIAKLLEHRPDIRSVGIPVDIRDNNAESGMGNLTSGIELRYRYIASLGFERNLTRIHRSIYQKLNNKKDKYFVLRLMAELDPALTDALQLCAHGCYDSSHAARAADILGYSGRRMRQLGVSNLGKVDFAGICPGAEILSFLFLPPKISYSREVAGISTFGNKLFVCYHDMLEL